MSSRGQAAVEYLATYGWAFMAAIIAIGALSYFGFISPTNLFPNKCSFGKQLECVEYQIWDNGTVNIIFRNNFGRKINITRIMDQDNTPLNWPAKTVLIDTGGTNTTSFNMPATWSKRAGDKAEINLIINFTRWDGTPGGNHSVSGIVFATVSDAP